MKIIKVKECLNCPYSRPTDLTAYAAICRKYGRYIKRLDGFPDFCRLETVSGDDKNPVNDKE